jgi:hypothetical protein
MIARIPSEELAARRAERDVLLALFSLDDGADDAPSGVEPV